MLYFMYYLLLLFYLLLLMVYFITSLWTLYYCLELQWMLLIMFFMINMSNYSGLSNYLIMNAIISITMIIGMLLCNSFLSLISCYNKMGYYPSILLFYMLYINSSYNYMFYDLINKWTYFSYSMSILNNNIYYRCMEYMLVLLNLSMIIYFIRIIYTIKHIMLISSYLLFMFLFLMMNSNNYLFNYIILLVGMI